MNENFDQNNITTYFVYLRNLSDYDVLFDKKSCFLDLLIYIEKDLYDGAVFQLILKEKIYETFGLILAKICSIRSKIDFSSINSRLSRSKRIISILKYLNLILNRLFLKSIDLRIYFNEEKTRLEPFITFIKDEKFIQSFMKLHPEFDGFINTLYFLAESSEDYKHIWQSFNAVEEFLKFARSIPKWSEVAYAIIALIAWDHDIEKMKELDEILSKFIHLTIDCIQNQDYSCDKQFDDEDSKCLIIQLRAIGSTNGYIYLIDYFLKTLYGLSINDKLKIKIFNYDNFFGSAKCLVYEGNDVERYFIIRLLTQLCFNKEVRDMILKDVEFIEFIKVLETGKESTYKKLNSICSSFLWLLSENENKPVIKEDHIMISYNSASKELCLKIKFELESGGYKVWMNDKESSLNSTAKAIQDSICVLMCVSEKYRLCINCRMEAQYALKINKAIIPIIIQPGYQNVSGWLGIIMSDKIFVDFANYEFQDSIIRLNIQIKLFMNKKQTNQIPIGLNEIANWNEEKVKEWCIANKLEGVFETLRPLDGKILTQIYELKKFEPEFFYKSLNSKQSLNTKIIDDFINALTLIFDK